MPKGGFSALCFRYVFFFQAEDGIRDLTVTGVQTCALPIYLSALLPSFRKADSDGLLETLHLAALATLSRAQSATLFSAHGAGNSLASSFAKIGRASCRERV